MVGRCGAVCIADNARRSRKRVLKPETVTIVYGRASSEDSIEARELNRPRAFRTRLRSRGRLPHVSSTPLAHPRIRRVRDDKKTRGTMRNRRRERESRLFDGPLKGPIYSDK